MLEPQLPPNEHERLRCLYRLDILDSDDEERFDRITRTTQRLFQVPIALISLADRDRQWFKSCQGLEIRETPRRVSFCAHAVLAWETFVVNDASRDPRFADNPLVTGPPHIRFYAGQPLRAPDGHLIGTLCVIDHQPRELDESQRRQLKDLANWAEREIGLMELFRRRPVGVANPPPITGEPPGPAVLSLEVQHLTAVADSLGPALEQLLLVAVYRRLRHRLRGTDQVITLDEGRFRILLPNSLPEGPAAPASRSGYARVAMRLQEAFREPFSLEGHIIPLRVVVTPVKLNPPSGNSPH